MLATALSLGCTLNQRCKDGDGFACLAARSHRPDDAALRLERRACELETLDGCELAGQRLQELWEPGEARLWFERGCVGGHRGSCTALVGLLLDRHAWIRDCASLADPVLADTVEVPMTLIGRGPSVRMQLELGELRPEAAQLRACLADVLDRTVLPPFAGEGITTFMYNLTIDRERTGVVDGYRRKLHTEFSYEVRYGAVGICPPDAPKDCHAVSTGGMQAVYSPQPLIEDLYWYVDTPRSAEVILRYCVNESGRSEYIEHVGDGPHHPIAQALVQKAGEWRFKPAVVDARPVYACVEQTYVYSFQWRSDWPA